MPCRTAALAIALALTGCAAPGSSDAIGAARDADRSAPVVDHPLPFAAPEHVPALPDAVALAADGDGFVAAWIEGGSIGALMAVRVGADGKPRSAAQAIHAQGAATFFAAVDAACAPSGACVVVGTDIDMSSIVIASLDADGTVRTGVGPIDHGDHAPRVVYDADAGAFLMLWVDDGVRAAHLDGAGLAETPFRISGGSVLGVGCAPGHGCLVDIAGVVGTAAVPLMGSTVGPATQQLSPLQLNGLTLAGDVYFTWVEDSASFGLVRVDLDGHVVDTTPLPIGPTEGGQRRVFGASFDGTAFDLLVHSVDDSGPAPVDVDVIHRVLPDGTAPAPSRIDLDGLPLLPGFACGPNVCEVASSSPNAAGMPSLSLASIRGSDVEIDATDLDLVVGDQDPLAALALGDEAIAVWREGMQLRSRAFSRRGEAAGPTRDVAEARNVVATDADGERGLLVLAGPHGELGTRLVSPDGELGPFVATAPPAHPRPDAGHFCALVPSGHGRLFMCFDAAGRLVAQGRTLPRLLSASPFGAVAARAGDLFVVLGGTETKGQRALRIWRISATDELVGDDPVEPALVPFDRDATVACSPTRCAIVTRGRDPGTGKRDLQVAVFEPKADQLAFGLSSTESGPFPRPVFDGEHFLVLTQDDRQFSVARIDGAVSPRTRVPLGDERPSFQTSPGGGDVVLFATRSRSVSMPPRELQEVTVWSIRGEGLAEAGGGGAGGGGGDAPGPRATNGCGCSDAGTRPDALAALVVAAAIGAALLRRRAMSRRTR